MDLKEMFGHRYVVTLDESWGAESPENRAEFEAQGAIWWYYEIKGKYGMVYPHGESIIAARVTPRIGKKLKTVLESDFVVIEDSIEALGFKTDVRNLKTILKFIKPKRRHQLTEERRRAMAAHMAAIRFRKPKNIKEKCTSGTLPGPIASEMIPTSTGAL